MNDSLGDRMKAYENVFRTKLPARMPVILRLDGKAFHTYTRSCKKPFDENLIACMDETALYLCNNIQGAMIAYIQSDEISILLNNYTSLETSPWFDNNLQKMCSVASGMASAIFTMLSPRIFGETRLATFDCRAFVLPKEEVNNAFLWRQNDATRNSIQMLARSLYSHKDCNNKKCNELQEMCFQKGKNWNDISTSNKRGRCAIKAKETKAVTFGGSTQDVTRNVWVIDNEIPIFSQNVQYINQYV